MENKNNKIDRILSALFEDTITKADFSRYFDKIVEIVKNLSNKFTKDSEDLKIKYTEYTERIGEEHKNIIEQVNDKYEETINAINNKIKEVKDGYTPVKDVDYFDGENPDPEDVVPLVLNKIKIPTLEELEKKIPKLGDKIRDSLELLRDDDRLDKTAIRGLQEEIDELKKQMISQKGGGGGGFKKIKWIAETPSGTIDGANTVFTLGTTPDPDNTLLVLNGAAQRNGSTYEYVLSGKTITYNTAPLSGSQHFCWYSKI